MRYLRFLPLLPAVVFSSENLLELEDVVVTETRHEIELKTAPSAITSVGAEELKLRSGESLRDLLLFDASLFTLRSRGTDFLGMRGFTQGRILILIDGRRLSGEVDRTFELDRITLDRVERIEVMKGPASVLYGTDALGGVVNVITREPLRREVNLSLRYGASPEEKQLSFSAYTGRIGKLNLGVFGRVKSRNAYVLPDGTTPSFQLGVKSAGLSLFHYPAEGSKIRFDYDYLDHDEKGVLAGGNTKILHSNLRQNLSLSFDADRRDWRFFVRGYASLYDKDFERRRVSNNQLTDFDVADRDLYVFESWFSKRLFLNHRFTLGGELRREVVSGTRIRGGEFKGKVIRENLSKDRYGEKIDYYAVYAQDELFLSENLFLIAGVRYDDSDRFESNLSPKIGATFVPVERIRIKANYAKGFKTPTPRELFIFFPGFGYWIVGNPDLGSERTDNLDAALEIDLFEDLTARGGIFYTEAEDLIETSFVCMGGVPGCTVDGTPVPPGTALITFRNVGRAEIRGAELSLQGRKGDKLLLGVSYTYMEAKDTVRDEPLLQRPRHRAVGRVVLSEKTFQLALFGEFVDGFLYTPDTDKNFSLVHVSFSRSIYRELELVGGVDNLGDKRDFDLGLLGRFYWIGIQGRL
ncbi:MAG TPA: TonB-dependent receptor [Aquifex aeolicus]|uniref:TonB-dependent receptor n=1 Tax=Aquifex aeolicus TaxID=63363 RepID=A0A7C5Q3L0_AQUAO|nr:TonB-dependent receptor [Aquifex aeolicus]